MTADERERRLALILAVAGLAAVGHAVIFIRLAEDAPALLLAAARVGVATLLFAPFALRAGRAGTMAGGGAGAAVALSAVAGVFLAVHFASWIESVQRLTIAESAVLVSLSPIWVAVIDIATGRGRPKPGVLIGILLCVAGVAAIGWDGLRTAEGDFVGLGLALLGGVAMAAYLCVGQRVRGRLPTSVYVTICYGSAALLLGLGLAASGAAVSGFSERVWLAILALGLISQGIGHTSYNFALGRLSPVFVAICLLGEPIVGSLLGLVYLGEAIPPATLIGGVPILIGVALALRAELNTDPGPTPDGRAAGR